MSSLLLKHNLFLNGLHPRVVVPFGSQTSPSDKMSQAFNLEMIAYVYAEVKIFM
jgi:hypothetical protein